MSWLESFSNAIKSSIASKLDKKEANAVFAKKTDLFSKEYSDLKNTPQLSDVAISGMYKDLLNKPTNNISVDVIDREYLIDQDGKQPILDCVFMLDSYTTLGFGLDLDKMTAYVYLINPEPEDGVKCIRYDTNFDEDMVELFGSSYSRIYSVLDKYGDVRLIVMSPNYNLHDGTAPMFYANLSDGTLIDQKHISLEFFETYWPSKELPTAIAASAVYEDGYRVNRYVAIMSTPLASSDIVASAYYSSTLFVWDPSDLHVKMNTSPSPYNHIGYNSIIGSSYGIKDNQWHFVAWGHGQDDEYKLACSADGIHWEYVEDISSKISARYATLFLVGSETLAMATGSGEFIISNDLDNWEIFCKINKYTNPDTISYGESLDDTDYSSKWQLTSFYGSSVNVAFSSSAFLTDDIVEIAIDGWSLSEDVSPYLLSACTADGSLNVYVLAREQVYETGRDTGNVFLYTFSYGLVNSGIVPEDMTKKVAEYIRPYMKIPKVIQNPPSSDGSYVLKCTVVDGVPTYTWEEAVPDGDEVSY